MHDTQAIPVILHTPEESQKGLASHHETTGGSYAVEVCMVETIDGSIYTGVPTQRSIHWPVWCDPA